MVYGNAYVKGTSKVEIQIVARRLGVMTAYQVAWNEWDEATYAYLSDAECRAVIASLLREWFSNEERLSGAQAIFEEPHELVVKGPVGICTWTAIDDMVVGAIVHATSADNVFVVEGESLWEDLLPKDNSANFDTIF